MIEDRAELIRLATMHCAPSRSKISSFLALSLNEQEKRMGETEIVAAFKHIFDCGGIDIDGCHIHPCTDLWQRLYEKHHDEINNNDSSPQNPVSKLMIMASAISLNAISRFSYPSQDIHMN
ncbi:MAG: hypothetical protein HYV65_01170 [Candidatus Spechtbacteria bacterium]|nr:hypothetical protein [Candidatus Spechtbacteria bacterium]